MEKEIVKKLDQIEYLAVTNKAMTLMNMLCLVHLIREPEEDTWSGKAFVVLVIVYILLATVHHLKDFLSANKTV